MAVTNKLLVLWIWNFVWK